MEKLSGQLSNILSQIASDPSRSNEPDRQEILAQLETQRMAFAASQKRISNLRKNLYLPPEEEAEWVDSKQKAKQLKTAGVAMKQLVSVFEGNDDKLKQLASLPLEDGGGFFTIYLLVFLLRHRKPSVGHSDPSSPLTEKEVQELSELLQKHHLFDTPESKHPVVKFFIPLLKKWDLPEDVKKQARTALGWLKGFHHFSTCQSDKIGTISGIEPPNIPHSLIECAIDLQTALSSYLDPLFNRMYVGLRSQEKELQKGIQALSRHQSIGLLERGVEQDQKLLRDLMYLQHLLRLYRKDYATLCSGMSRGELFHPEQLIHLVSKLSHFQKRVDTFCDGVIERTKKIKAAIVFIGFVPLDEDPDSIEALKEYYTALRQAMAQNLEEISDRIRDLKVPQIPKHKVAEIFRWMSLVCGKKDSKKRKQIERKNQTLKPLFTYLSAALPKLIENTTMQNMKLQEQYLFSKSVLGEDYIEKTFVQKKDKQVDIERGNFMRMFSELADYNYNSIKLPPLFEDMDLFTYQLNMKTRELEFQEEIDKGFINDCLPDQKRKIPEQFKTEQAKVVASGKYTQETLDGIQQINIVGLHHWQGICSQIKGLQAALFTANFALLPHLKRCSEQFPKTTTPPKDVDALTLWIVGEEMYKKPARKAPSVSRVVAAPPSVEEVISIPEPLPVPAESVIPEPVTQFFNSAAKRLSVPHLSISTLHSGVKRSERREVFARDSFYHLFHARCYMEMAVDMMRNHPSDLMINDLMPFLLHDRYLAVEQAWTWELNPPGNLVHSLHTMSQDLGRPSPLPNDDRGSLAFRYPSQSQMFAETESVKVGLGLAGAPSSQKLLKKTLGVLSKVFGHHEELKLDDFVVAETKPIDPKLFEGYQERLATAVKQLEGAIQSDSSPRNIALKDMRIHVQRLQVTIDAFTRYPQQRYLSAHVQGMLSSGQVFMEMAGFILSLDFENEGVKTHDLGFFNRACGLNAKLPKRSKDVWKAFDLHKGREYPHSKLKHERRLDFSEGMKLLLDTYELSRVAICGGEGFTQKGLPSPTNTMDRISKLLKEQVALFEDVVALLTPTPK